MIEKLIINRKDQQVNRTVEYKLPVLPPCGYIITNINRPLFAEVCGGVELGKAQPMVAFEGEAVIFDGRLIHGVGHNRSKRVRFSLDFRVWSKTVAEGAASVRGELLRKMEKNQGAV